MKLEDKILNFGKPIIFRYTKKIYILVSAYYIDRYNLKQIGVYHGSARHFPIKHSK